MAKKWAKFPHADKAYALRRRGAQEALGAAAQGRLRAVAEGRRRRSTRGGTSTRATSPQAVEAGTAAGGAGVNAAVKAQIVYANYLEKIGQGEARAARGGRGLGRRAPRAKRRRTPTRTTSTRSRSAATARASRSRRRWRRASAARSRTRSPTALKLEPKHADAHTAFGAYQAEVIDKVGGIVAGVTYGAKKDSALEHYREGAEAQSRFARSRASSTRTASSCCSARRGSPRREALRGGGGVQARRRDGAARRRAREVGAGVAATLPALALSAAHSTPTALPQRQDRDRRRAATAPSASSARSFSNSGAEARDDALGIGTQPAIGDERRTARCRRTRGSTRPCRCRPTAAPRT